MKSSSGQRQLIEAGLRLVALSVHLPLSSFRRTPLIQLFFLLPFLGEGGEMRLSIEPDERYPLTEPSRTCPPSSFRRKPESSFTAPSWTPTFVGVTRRRCADQVRA